MDTQTTAEVITISGLRGDVLEAFRRASAIVATSMRGSREPLFDPRAESLMREVRKLLGYAHQCEAVREIELADSFGARAGNRLAAAILLSERKP